MRILLPVTPPLISVNLETRLINIKRSDHNHTWWCDKVSFGNVYLLHDILTDNIDVILELCRNGNNGCTLGYCPLWRKLKTTSTHISIGNYRSRPEMARPEETPGLLYPEAV